VPEPAKAPGDREVDMAGALVESLHAEFEAERFSDEHRERILAFLERKRRGEAPEPEPAPEPERSDDLLAALQASLEGAKR
jgi:DNA end-binding protein Ku